MKKTLLVLALASLVCVGCQKKKEPPAPSVTSEPSIGQKTETAVRNAAEKTRVALDHAADKTRDAAVEAKDALNLKLVEWKLTPADIRAELDSSGRIVRAKAGEAALKSGEFIDNARVVTAIKAKLLGDSQLSALTINVDSDRGVVTLKGTVKTLEMVGRAITLALETTGVSRVVSLLTVAA